ncbi:MAG TPA: FecR family protein [bacterium]|nr:FecR family protein [bacterium]HOL67374.1 FecR family protein [bacterium]
MVQRAQTSEWQALRIKDRVYPGDTIKTGFRSRLTLCLVDETTITLGPQSDFQLDNFSFTPSKNQREASVKVLMGKARFSIRRVLAAPSRFQVTTPTAVAGVKGTKFVVWVLSTELSRFLVTQGVITIRNLLPSLPAEIVLRAGFASDVRSGQEPLAPYRLSSEEFEEFLGGTTGMDTGAGLDIKRHVFQFLPGEDRHILLKGDTAGNVFRSALNERESRNIPRLLPPPPPPPSLQGG